MEQSGNMKLEKEIFLREQIVSVYMFSAKTLIALSSGTLALSVGLQGMFDGNKNYICSFVLISGWLFVLLTIFLTACAIKTGLQTLYQFINNLNAGQPELNNHTESNEEKMSKYMINGFVSYISGVLMMLLFIYINFLA
jgi:hypothetical protein